MQKRLFNIWAFIIVFSLLTGILCNGLFLFIYLCIGIVIAMGLTVVGFIIDLIAKSSKGIRLTGFILFFFLIATATSFVRMKISESFETRVANKIIVVVYTYKHQTGHFPKNLDQLNLDSKTKSAFIKDQHYWTDSSKQQFEIRGWSDGWNIKTFHSSDSAWVLQD